MHACTHGKGTAGLVGIRRGIKNSLEVAQPLQTRGKGRRGASIASAGTFSRDTGSVLPG